MESFLIESVWFYYLKVPIDGCVGTLVDGQRYYHSSQVRDMTEEEMELWDEIYWKPNEKLKEALLELESKSRTS